MNNKTFPYIVAISAFLVAFNAAFFSVYGLSKLFAGAATSVIFMAGSLEFSKLVAASFLFRYWNRTSGLLKTYLTIGVVVLVFITSAGIFGYLSNAYQGATIGFQKETSLVLGIDAYQINTVGMFSTAIGHSALKNSAFAYNTALGYNAGANLTTGGGNVCIGYEAQASAPDVSNEVTLGADTITKTRLQGSVTIPGTLTLNDNLTINAGELKVPSMQTSTGVTPNLHIDANGVITNVTDAFYLAKEVDGLISAKDKVIDALSARLDSLELKFKALK